MKTSFWRHWLQSLRETRQTGSASRRKPRRSFLALEALENRIALSITPQMVLDINANTLPSNPSQLTAVGSLNYFIADDGIHGQELWKSDGTAAGTALVKDISPGSAGAFDQNGYYQNDWLTDVSGTLFFTANDGTHGFELWKSDGSETGTVPVQDINPGSAGSLPSNLTNVNGTLFFSAYDGVHGSEMWKSDGTAAGTVLIKDINPGGTGSYPASFTNVNGTLFFSASDSTTGSELWKTDGTAAGTVIVKDINPGSANSAPANLTNVSGTLFFSASDGTTGSELWKSDGTAAGTALVKDINTAWFGASSDPGNLTAVNGTLYFTASDGTNGNELWKSDGTAAGTALVKDISLGYVGSYPRSLTNVNGTLFFSASDNANGPTTGNELWKSDGTAVGTTLVEDINPGSISSYPRSLTNVNGTLYFTADDGTHGTEVWKSDGTAAGTALVDDINPGIAIADPGSLTNVNGTLMFAANDGRHGVELWKSNGTAAGTTLVKDINTNTYGSNPGSMTDVNGTLFFSADDGVHGGELWKSAGTVAGTTLVKDIIPGGFIGPYGGYYFNGSDPNNLTNVNGTLFFTTNNGLWKSDGTEAGTVLVSNVNASQLTNVNGTLFFTAGGTFPGDTDGIELWKSDGTAAGTTQVKDIYPGVHRGYNYGYGYSYFPNSSNPGGLTNVNGTLYFSADDGVDGRELWKSDGTAAGTVLVKDMNPGSTSSFPYSLMNMNGTLFFSALDGTTGRELWKSDGTAAGTVLVKDINPGGTGSYPTSFTNINGTLLFSASDGATGAELWKTDGTAAGTILIKDINPGSTGSSPTNLTNVNGTLFFTVYSATTGSELWKSDGTTAGTALVKDINAGSARSYPTSLTNVNGTLFFTANDGTGTKLWQSDGTAAGTRIVANLSVSALADVGRTLFFAADDGIHGTELWSLVDDGATQGTTLYVSGFPAAITAGAAGSFTVTAKNADGSTNTSYLGSVHFTSSDPRAVLPAGYSFTAADKGAHTFSTTLKTAGSQSITVTDNLTPNITGGETGITVTPAAASHFAVSAPAQGTAGSPSSVTVTALDPYNNQVTGYAGTIHFTSSDGQASLPANYTFTSADAGAHTFTNGVTLKTAGTQTVTATDTSTGSITGGASVLVNAASASAMIVAGFPSPITAGVAGSFTVTLKDAYGNVATGYTGTVHFTSSDAKAVLPVNYTFTGADSGKHTFSATLKTAGRQSITATDTVSASLRGTDGGITVKPASASKFLLTAPNSVTAGVRFSLTVTVEDAYGNIVTGYTGTVHFTSSDSRAFLPANYTFTAGDNGVHTFTGLALKKTGNQTITVTDTHNSGITGKTVVDVL